MKILAQDRQSYLNSDQVFSIKVSEDIAHYFNEGKNGCHIIGFSINERLVDLGYYETKERAIEILYDLFHLSNGETYFEMPLE